MSRAAIPVWFAVALAMVAACEHLSDGPVTNGPPDAAVGSPRDAGGFDAGVGAGDVDGAGQETGSPSEAARPVCPVLPHRDGAAPVPTAGITNLVPLPVSVVPAGGAFSLAPT